MIDRRKKRARRRRRRNKEELDPATDEKSVILHHRAYRIISLTDSYIILKFLLLTIPLIIAVFFLFPKLTLLMNNFARYFLTSSFPYGSVELFVKPYMKGEIHLLHFPVKYASPFFSFLVFLFSLLSIYFLSWLKIPKPLMLWIMSISVINLLSAVFFILAPSAFPYNIKMFSELYVTTEINIWMLIPLVTGMVLLPLPAGSFSKFMISVTTLLYSVVFGIIRYTLFLIILEKFSLLFMTVLFFVFGPLMDFFYIVGIYSLYVSRLSKKIGKDVTAWSWSY